MSFRDQLGKIAAGYLGAKNEKFAKHPMAIRVRNDWKREAAALLGEKLTPEYKIDSSSGQGNWADAPWLAIFHKKITFSAMVGFYPVYLFEPGFKTVCLVMGQGAETLLDAIGKTKGLVELKRRAVALRDRGGKWKEMGFNDGPFQTLKAVSKAAGFLKDPWSTSAAFGKRYEVSNLPSDEDLASDLKLMLDLYGHMALDDQLQFGKTDEEVGQLKEAGELPKSDWDGAKKLLTHKQVETRQRNRKLISAVKKNLGSKCQACGYALRDLYGSSMSGYVEAHHIVPLHTLPAEGAELEPTEKDFCVLCSNCHKAIHRAGCPPLEKFKAAFLRISEWPAPSVKP